MPVDCVPPGVTVVDQILPIDLERRKYLGGMFYETGLHVLLTKVALAVSMGKFTDDGVY
ncbi:MAG: hypothetical protein ACI854_002537 [Arenicella sp.]